MNIKPNLHPTMERRVRKGFTLIELLVVIAIIAILLSILLPSLSLARAQARQVVCGTGLRNLHMAVFFYAEDSRDYHHASWSNSALRFRPALSGRRVLINPRKVDDRGRGDAYWSQLYDDYLGSKHETSFFQFSNGLGGQESLPSWKNSRCPDAKYMLKAFRRKRGTPSENPGDTGGSYFDHDPYTLWSTYAFNGVTPGFDGIPEGQTPTFFRKVTEGSNSYRVPTQLTSIKFHSELIMAQDGAEVMMDGNGDTIIQLSQWNDQRDPGWKDEYFRHPGGSVIVWLDGHVSPIARNQSERELDRLRKLTRGGQVQVPLTWYSARN